MSSEATTPNESAQQRTDGTAVNDAAQHEPGRGVSADTDLGEAPTEESAGAEASVTVEASREADHDASGEVPETGASADKSASEAPLSDAAEQGGEAEAHDAEAGEAESGEAGEGEGRKRKRRRRRKKKGAGAAAEGESSAPPKSERPQRGRPERPPFHVGEEVFGKVTSVLDTAVMIDLSGKALGIFDRTEMEADDLVPSVGDRFVARVHNDGARGGLVVLTRKPLREEEAKPAIEQAFKDGTLISGLVTGVIKGGIEVDINGVRAFAPASGMDLHPSQANFTALLGQRLEFKVVQYEKQGRDVVVTRRPMLEAEAHERRKVALGVLQEGQVMRGIVRTVVEWGVFVALPDAENLEGLVHVSEASHDPRAHLAELFKPGEELEVKIIRIDERGKIWLSRKALVSDPWGEARQKFASGSIHKGTVTRLEKFGAFIELEPGVEGLLHVTDLSVTRIEHPKDVLKEGQELEVVVNHFDARTKKISLHPAPPPERRDEPRQKVARGATLKVEVVKGESAGVIVRVLGATGRGARGFIPAGQTGTSRGTDLRKVFKPGSVLDTKVVDVDPRSGEPRLSIRELKEDEERRAHKEYRQKLKAESSFGTLGDLLKKKLDLAAGDRRGD